MSEMSESAKGLFGQVTFFKSDGTTPAKIDGDPRWSLENDSDGNPVGNLTVNPDNKFQCSITPAKMPEGITTHTAQGKVEGDGDLDAGEERLVTANFVITVFTDEAQSAGVTFIPLEQATGNLPPFATQLPSTPIATPRPGKKS